jgi:preprotein translocase subunit YajC
MNLLYLGLGMSELVLISPLILIFGVVFYFIFRKKDK